MYHPPFAPALQGDSFPGYKGALLPEGCRVGCLSGQNGDFYC